jgi:ABC-2 type transport system ATP-binding protein
MADLIVTENLVKFFGDVPALSGLNLNVPKGISGFIGPNGAGKTTTINILLGLLKPTTGNASVFGLDSWHDSFEIRRKLGVLHEKPAYLGNFTAQKYLQHVAKIYDVSEWKQKSEEILTEVGLSSAKDKSIRTYSAGMTQRLGLAQALIGDPELVILDEPTANLDPLGRIEILEMIKALNESRGVSFFVSTHILPELEKVCRWVSIIDEGEIVAQGNLSDLMQKYSANIYRIEVSSPESFAEQISREKNLVERVWIEESVVYCKVKDAGKFHSKVPKLAAEMNIQMRSMQPLRSSLEEIFKTTVGGSSD